MDIEFLTNADAPPPPPTAAYSHAVRAGDFLFVTGQLGVNPKTGTLVSGGAAEQTRQTMKNLETVLRGAGTHGSGWTPMGRMGTPADIGNAVALLCSPDAGWITGQLIYADGGASLADTLLPLEIQHG